MIKNTLHKFTNQFFRTMFLPRSTFCQLCATEIENLDILRTHLLTRLHMDREKEIGFEER